MTTGIDHYLACCEAEGMPAEAAVDTAIATLHAFTPKQVGILDAQEHKPFAPETYYARMWDRVEYASGFRSVNNSLIAADYIQAAYLTQMELDEDERAHYEECRNMGRPGGL